MPDIEQQCFTEIKTHKSLSHVAAQLKLSCSMNMIL